MSKLTEAEIINDNKNLSEIIPEERKSTPSHKKDINKYKKIVNQCDSLITKKATKSNSPLLKSKTPNIIKVPNKSEKKDSTTSLGVPNQTTQDKYHAKFDANSVCKDELGVTPQKKKYR